MPTTPNPQNSQPPKPWPTRGGAGASAPSAERVREQLRLFLILLLGLIIVSQLPLPFRLGGFVLALGIGWVGISLLIGMSALSRSGATVRGWPSVIIGLALAGLLTVLLIGQAIVYPITVDQERCLSGANTLKAKDTCDRIYQERLRKLTDGFTRSTP